MDSSRERDGAHLLNGRFRKAKSATPRYSHTSDPPNTPEGASEPLVLYLAIKVLPSGEDGTLWNEALLDIAPERNREFARNCHDRDPLDASALSIGPL